jgi:ubiquinone/menaquinone biosynthesis C-methylase UbiE
VAPNLAITAIDSDAAILDMARSRLASLGVTPACLHGSFMDVALPACDVIVSSFALHHIADAGAKQELYRRLQRALAPNGMLVLVDCYPASDATLARRQLDAWRAHVRGFYSDAETDGLFAAWAEEDTYMPLADEMTMMRVAGFAPEVIWRRDAFAVLAARTSL